MRPLVAAFAVLLPPGVFAKAAPALEKVKLQLKWKHQFQFAGYYAAIERACPERGEQAEKRDRG